MGLAGNDNAAEQIALASWCALTDAEAAEAVLPCCGSHAWALGLAQQRPFANAEALFAASDEVWSKLPESDWQEAFRSHPRIGERHAQAATAQSLAWSSGEQSAVMDDTAVQAELARGNVAYEARFGRIFLIRAAGRGPREILAALQQRLQNDDVTELREAVEQQRQITQLRLRKWLDERTATAKETT